MEASDLYIGGGILAGVITILKGKEIWDFFGKLVDAFKHHSDSKNKTYNEVILLHKEQNAKLEARVKELEKKKSQLEKLLIKCQTR